MELSSNVCREFLKEKLSHLKKECVPFEIKYSTTPSPDCKKKITDSSLTIIFSNSTQIYDLDKICQQGGGFQQFLALSLMVKKY